jgi:hypothetical protein
MFARKNSLVVRIVLDSNLFYNQDLLHNMYFGANISCILYPNMMFHIPKLKRKERSTTLQL